MAAKAASGPPGTVPAVDVVLAASWWSGAEGLAGPTVLPASIAVISHAHATPAPARAGRQTYKYRQINVARWWLPRELVYMNPVLRLALHIPLPNDVTDAPNTWSARSSGPR